MTPRTRLDSWKAIADYFGRDIRTVIRWEKERGLPVHRVPGGRSRTVFAYPEELQEWLAGANLDPAEPAAPAAPEAETSAEAAVPESRYRPVFILAGILALAAGAVVIAFAGNPPPAVARVALADHGIEAFDDKGKKLWRFPIANLPAQAVLETEHYEIADIDDDGRAEVVLAVIETGSGTYTGSLRVIGDDGRLRWQRQLDDRLTFSGVSYGPTWLPDDVAVYRVGGETRITAAFHHHTWWPSVTATFNGRGDLVDRFVNSGWIYNVRTSPDGSRVYAAGVSNELGGAVLAVFDAARVSGRSPDELSGPTRACQGCPNGLPMAYFLLPWSDVARPEQSPKTRLNVLPSGEIELQSPQVIDGDVPSLILTISPSLQILHASANDATWPEHAILERRGLLTHPGAACPWRTPVVKVWGLTPFPQVFNR